MDLDPKEAENGDIGIMTLSDFKTWSSISLKTFLSLRKKQTNGSFDVLAARAFAAYEDGVPVDPKQEHIQRQLLKEYKEKLIIEGISIPDPIDLSIGWLGEEKGMSKWPRLYITDITRFYSDVIGKKDLIQRIESEYKQGKAYRYFSDSFIGEIFYNDISDTSPFCLFRTKCMPSQRISMKQYSIWAVVRKDGTDKVGGEILHAVITGVSNPTCTSVKAYWVVPSKKKVIEPDEVSKFLFTQDKYLKKSTQQPVDQRKQNKQAKMSFQVMSNSQKELLNKGDVVRRNLYDEIKLYDVLNSCFVELIEGAKKKSKPKPKHDIPTLKEFAESFKDGCDEDLH